MPHTRPILWLLLAVLPLAACNKTSTDDPVATDATMQQGIDASVEDVTAAEAARQAN